MASEHGATIASKLQEQIAKVFVGKGNEIELLLAGFLSGLHVLIEDIPGVGKTTLARTLAVSAGLDYGRIQFTPDLLPGDITGVTVWSQESHDFVYKTGAIMHQFILADEINRASSRTQSALLEAMQERAVTVDGTTYPLMEPFFVVATQNPLNFAGTFQLPEGQLDRFGLALSIGYPAHDEEVTILDRFKEENPLEVLTPVISGDDVIDAREQIRHVRVDRKIKDFLVSIAGKTRQNRFLRLGMSPRSSQHLFLASQAAAYINGRDYVVPEDVLDMVTPVLRHRLILSAEARMENKTPEAIIQSVLDGMPVPAGI
jgi:MoxR-like ATPase